MSIRNKTKRRLLVLVGTVLVVTTLACTAVWIRLAQDRSEAALDRDLAIAAAKDDRHAQAIDHFRRAMKYYDQDPETLYWLAHARREVPLPNDRHLEEAVNYLDNAVRLRPDDRRAEHELLELYALFRRDTEALRLADRVLASDPADVKARRSRIMALVGLSRLDEALAEAREGIEAFPDEYRYYLHAIDIMQAQKLPAEQVLALGRAALDKHPDDPRFKLVMGLAYGAVGQRQEALDAVQPLAESLAPDEDFLATLVSIYDQLWRYDLSLTALRAGAKVVVSPRLSRMLLRRLWESGDHEAVLAELAGLDPASAKVRSESIALKALALIVAGKGAESKELLKVLEGRTNDPQAEAWAIVLRQSMPDEPRTTAQVLEALNTAIARDPNNPYLFFARGEALSQLDEGEAAIVQWNRATRNAASWYLPYMRMAQGFSALGRHEEAEAAAVEARRRSPQNTTAIITQLEVRYNALKAGFGSAGARGLVLDQLADIQRQAPNEPRTLAMYVDLLGEKGDREKATAVLGAALNEPKSALDEEVLTRLATISREHKLGLEEAVFTRWEASHKLTPALALGRAQSLIATTGATAVRQFMASVLDQIGDARSQRNWRVVYARVLDQIDDPLARELWGGLVRDFPDDLAIQRGALEARGLRGDQKVLGFAVDRIKAITGESGVSWRVAQARLMMVEGASRADLATAAGLLKAIVRDSPSMVEPRILLAGVQRRLGVTDGAIEQLNQVASLQPGNSAVLVELAGLCVEQGDFAGARSHLERLTPRSLSTPQIEQVASVWLALGEYAKASKLLEPLHETEPTDARSGLLLAQAYARMGELAKAQAVLAQLLAEPSASVIAAHAELLAASGKYDEGLSALALLNDPRITAYDREMALAGFHRRFIDRAGADKVASHLRAASEAQPKNPVPYRALAALYLQQGKLDEALAANAAGAKALPDDTGFALVDRESELIRDAAAIPILKDTIAQVVESGPYRDQAVEAMKVVVGSRQNNQEVLAASRKLRQAADRSPRSIVIQNLMADWYLITRQAGAAADLATRTMRAFPRDASTAERATKALVEARRWEEAMSAAEEWRRRAPSRAAAADLAIAQALVNLGQAARALERLEPYRSAAIADPTNHGITLGVYAGALVAAGRVDDAATLLKPLLADSPSWRMFWMSVASDTIRDVKVAVQWLERVTPVVPADSSDERVALAQAWSDLASRENGVALGDRAIETLAPLAAKADTDPRAIYFYGVVLYNQATRLAADAGQAALANDLLAQAEAAYRRCIEKSPESWSAMNNLAVLIAERGGSIDEAAKLAERAIKLQPDRAALHDTLADIELRRKQYDRAVASLERSIDLDPTNPEWRVNLAYALKLKGDRRRMGEVLRDLNPTSERVRSLSPPIRQRLDALLVSLKDQSAAK